MSSSASGLVMLTEVFSEVVTLQGEGSGGKLSQHGSLGTIVPRSSDDTYLNLAKLPWVAPACMASITSILQGGDQVHTPSVRGPAESNLLSPPPTTPNDRQSPTHHSSSFLHPLKNF